MSNRTIALLVLAVVVAAAVTVEATYFVLERFVLHDPNDPLTKAADYRRPEGKEEIISPDTKPPDSTSDILGASRASPAGIAEALPRQRRDAQI
jgi:hypothetical protein